MRTFVAMLLVIFVAACQTTDSASLPTNTFTFNADKTRTKEAIIATFMPRGYQIVRDSEFQLVMDRPATDNFAAQLLLGSRFNSVPNARVLMTVTGNKPTTVHTQVQVVTNPGSGFEQASDFSNNVEARETIVRAMAEVRATLGS